MTKVEVELPEEALHSLRATPEELAREMRFAAAVHWYHQRLISGSKAAQITGMRHLEFLDELARRKLTVLDSDVDELEQELDRGWATGGGGVDHEIKSSVMAIIMAAEYAKAVLDEGTGEDVGEVIDKIAGEARRCARIVDSRGGRGTALAVHFPRGESHGD
ncbi:MAG: UPF0175 family protein [Candidatus Schekmanbacteria bacterium]|nr:UPF0175 family protein [Candidatus Schekmanbacteria bacterium]